MTTLLFCLLCLSGWYGQEPPDGVYSQTYAIFIRGTLAGTETVREQIEKDGSLVCSSQHEMLVTDGLEIKRLAFETKSVFDKNTPVPREYSFQYTSGDTRDYCELTIKDGKINRVLSRGGNLIESTDELLPGTVILDFNVYHQYDLLPRLYDFKKGGRQLFTIFIPVIGSGLPLAITRLEDGNLDYGKGTIPVRNFKIEIVGVRTGNFSTDTNGRLVRIIMREQDLEVVRKDLVPDK